MLSGLCCAGMKRAAALSVAGLEASRAAPAGAHNPNRRKKAKPVRAGL